MHPPTVCLQEQREAYMARRWMLVFRIQTMSRRFRLRRRLRIRNRYNAAAVRIRAWLTGVRVRFWYREHVRKLRIARLVAPLFRRFSKARHAAARTIQRFFWWSHIHRMSRRLVHKYFQDRREDAIRHYISLHTKATQIQNIYRMHDARKEYLKWLAANKIVSVARGFFARRYVREVYKNVRLRVAKAYLKELFRRMVPRVAPKLWWKRMQNASKMQKSVRIFLRFKAMLRAKARAKAALSLQRYYQGIQGRRLYRRAKRRWQYNQANIYRDEIGVTTVLVTFRSQTKVLYDPRDDTVGMHFAAWLRRLGVLECYTPLTEHGMDSVELLCNANDKQLEAAGVESQADRDRILNFFVDGGAADGSGASFADFAFATSKQATALMTEKFPKAGITRTRNFAVMAGGQDISISAIKAIIERCTDPAELRAHVQNLVNWKMKSKSHIWDVKRVAQYVPLANMAIWRIVELEGTRGVGPELLAFAEKAEVLWRLKGDDDLELSPEQETLRMASMSNENKIKAAEILGSGIVLANEAVAATSGLQRIFRGLVGRRRGRRLLEIERRRQRLLRLERERRERERLRHEAEMEALRQHKIQGLLWDITRFGWQEVYDEEDGTYFISDFDESVIWERPLYTVPEYDSAKRIQIYIRRLLARRLVARIRWDIANTNLREKRAREWDKKAAERQMLVVLRWDYHYPIQPEGPTAEALAKEVKRAQRAKKKKNSEELAKLTPLPLHTGIVGRMVRLYFPQKRQDKDIEHRKVLRLIGRLFDHALCDAFLIIDERKANRIKQKRRRKNKRKKGKGGATSVESKEQPTDDEGQEDADEEEEEEADGTGAVVENNDDDADSKSPTEPTGNEAEDLETPDTIDSPDTVDGDVETDAETDADVATDTDTATATTSSKASKAKRKKKKKKKIKKGFATNGKATKGEKKMIHELVVSTVNDIIKRHKKYRKRVRKAIGSLVLDMVSDAVEIAVEQNEAAADAKDDAAIASRWREGVISLHQPLTDRHMVTFLDEVQISRIRRGKSIADTMKKPRRYACDQRRKWNADTLWIDFKDPDLVVQWLDVDKPIVKTQLDIDKDTYICRFGWEQVPDTEDPNRVFYWNDGEQVSSWDHPDYTFEEVEAAENIQRLWRGLNGRRRFRYLVAQQRVDKYLQHMVERAAGIAWYGYGLEGMTPQMWLTRLGFGDDTIHDLITLACSRNPALKSSKKVKASKLSLNRLKSVSTKRLMTVSTLSRTDLKYFQVGSIYTHTNPETRPETHPA